MEKPAELISALYDGRIISRKHEGDGREYIFIEDDGHRKHIGIRGWGTAFGKPTDRLESLMLESDQWEILENHRMSDGYPFPWSASYNKPLVCQK